jgi:translocator protein
MTRRNRPWIQPVAIAASAALLVAVLGALMTDLGPWYQSLKQPPWKPPDWLFGPAWTLIFALAAVSGVLAWRNAPSDGYREWLLLVFACNGFLNVLWSLLYFRVRRPDWALAEVGLLWLSILALIALTSRSSKRAGWLLVPYLVWVTVAAVLNWATAGLNGPFGQP